MGPYRKKLELYLNKDLRLDRLYKETETAFAQKDLIAHGWTMCTGTL